MTLYFLDCEMHCGGKLDGIWLWDSANVLEQVTRSLHLSPSAFLVVWCIRPGDMREMVVGGGTGGICFNNICLFTWLNWVSAAVHGAFGFRCTSGFFNHGIRTLGCGMWDLIPLPGMGLGPPALGARSLSHWTTRDAPMMAFIV